MALTLHWLGCSGRGLHASASAQSDVALVSPRSPRRVHARRGFQSRVFHRGRFGALASPDQTRAVSVRAESLCEYRMASHTIGQMSGDLWGGFREVMRIYDIPRGSPHTTMRFGPHSGGAV